MTPSAALLAAHDEAVRRGFERLLEDLALSEPEAPPLPPEEAHRRYRLLCRRALEIAARVEAELEESR